MADILPPLISGNFGANVAFVRTAADVLTPRTRDEVDREEIHRLRAVHLDYASRAEHWMFMLDSYEGGPNYVRADTLHKHQRENSTDYEDRLRRAYYQNYCQPLVDFVPEFIFSQGVIRAADGDLAVDFTRLEANCDRAGSSLDVFMQQIAEDARIFGMCFVQLDKLPPPADQDPESLSVQRASELGIDLPYLINVKPLEILDWRVDQTGHYIFLKRIETLSYFDGTDYIDIERVSEWWPTHKQISLINIDEVEKPYIISQIDTPNPWHEIPFVPVFYKRSKINRDLGQSFLQDIAYGNRQVFNLTSLLDEFLYRQCFNLLMMETQSVIPRRDQMEGNIGTGNVLEVPPAATMKPSYLSPPVEPAEFLQSERARVIEEMYRQAAQDLMTQITRSGEQVKQIFNRTIPVIAKTADMLQVSEIRIFNLWAKMMGKEWKGKIAYRDDYSVTNLQDLILQLTSIFNSLHVMSPTFVREEWKRIVHEFDGKISPDTMAIIVAEIDAVSDDDIKSIVKPPDPMQILDHKAALGVPSTANMIQGKAQTGKTDRQISLGTGNKASSKEAAPDANKRAKKGRALTKSTQKK